MDEQQQLTNAYHSNKLSHAYLFEGDDAQTMKQVAINFAKLILCQTDSQCETKVSTMLIIQTLCIYQQLRMQLRKNKLNNLCVI